MGIIVDSIFADLYTIELVIKLCAQGCHEFFIGEPAYWNWYETVVVALALLDIIFAQLKDLNVNFLKLLRVSRFARLVRVIRMSAMKDLANMMCGLMAGAPILVWSVALVAAMTYTLAVIVTTVFRSDGQEIRTEIENRIENEVSGVVKDMLEDFHE